MRNVLIGLLLVIGIGLAFLFTRSSEIPESADRITLTFGGQKPNAKPIVLRDAKSCQDFLFLLRSAEPTTPHKCARLLIAKIDNGIGSVEVSLLPGHDPEFYECIRDGEWMKFSRDSFFRIKEIGSRKSDFLLAY